MANCHFTNIFVASFPFLVILGNETCLLSTSTIQSKCQTHSSKAGVCVSAILQIEVNAVVLGNILKNNAWMFSALAKARAKK
jgi:hypothetical protein